jgi:hypothetical protein
MEAEIAWCLPECRAKRQCGQGKSGVAARKQVVGGGTARNRVPMQGLKVRKTDVATTRNDPWPCLSVPELIAADRFGRHSAIACEARNRLLRARLYREGRFSCPADPVLGDRLMVGLQTLTLPV